MPRGRGCVPLIHTDSTDACRYANGIEATESTSTQLPALTAKAIRFAKHGPPEEVLHVESAHRMPETLRHGEVLVRMRLF